MSPFAPLLRFIRGKALRRGRSREIAMRTMVRTMVAVALLGSAGLAQSGGCDDWGCGSNSPVVEGAGGSAPVVATPSPEGALPHSSKSGVVSSPCPKWGCGENSPVVDAAGRTAGSPDASIGKAAARRVKAR
jgi:hypothetical protein